jgi:hypothetical protein
MHRRLICSVLVSLAAVICGVGEASAASAQVDSNVRQREVRGQTVQSERDEQEALFNYYFREKDLTYEAKLENLESEASVPNWRIPYSAAIHPETSGGLSDVRAAPPVGLFARRRTGAGVSASAVSSGSSALSVYDRAFNGGQNLANSYEINRILDGQRALFPARRMRSSSESWEGYCSGFTASTIRHPEPIRSVDAGRVGGTPGVVLRPSDIKALLSCIYNRTTPDSFLFLAPPSARDGGPNMGTFHLTLANYVGQAGTPVGMDRSKGQVAWNNPIYAYRVNSVRDAGSEEGLTYKDVETTVTYSYYSTDTSMQTDLDSGDRVGNRKQSMTLRYKLALDDEGRIVGGRALNSSGHFLWLPLYAVQAKPDGSVQGNPYVDVRKVIAVARAASLADVQAKFDAATIGPRLDPAVDPASEQPEDADDSDDSDEI